MVAGVAGVVRRGARRVRVPPADHLLVLLFALVMAVVSSRATGETDLAPVGAVGTVTQLLFSRCGAIGSMLFASVAFGTSTQAAQTLWALKAGQKLHAEPRPQLVAQLIGALLGAAVVAPVYVILLKAYGIGTESLPAPSGDLGEGHGRGDAGRAQHAAALRDAGGGGVGLAVGAVLALLARGRWARFCPSPAAMGIAMLIPPALSVAGLAGVLLARGGCSGCGPTSTTTR